LTPAGVDLGGWIATQRWFAAKSRRIVATHVEDRIQLAGATIHLVRVELDDDTIHTYAVPLRDDPPLTDAFDDPPFCRALLDLIATAGRAGHERGAIVGRPSVAFPPTLPADVAVRRVTGEQSNTSVTFGNALIVKHIRRIVAGVNPELEVSRYLTEQAAFPHIPRLAGTLEYLVPDGTPAAFAVAHELVADSRDGWRWLLERLQRGDSAGAALRRLGERTAALHVAFGHETVDPAFDAEPITTADVAAWTHAVQGQLDAARAALGGHLPEGAATRVDAAGLAGLVGAVKLRHHGDFHLGQTLAVRDGEDFYIIDFEGEPLRSLDERRRKHTPLRDVAGMLRSLGYAAATARAPQGWEAQARTAFLEGYRASAGRAPFLPRDGMAFTRALAVFEVEKAAYEIVYEANNRPDWVAIPVRGLVTASAALRSGRAAGAA
jgi:maltose alpha-D-glucosyltransferase/alpha-amylase